MKSLVPQLKIDKMCIKFQALCQMFKLILSTVCILYGLCDYVITGNGFG